jgi:RimJ/RimL family protein N-acetyltransferase
MYIAGNRIRLRPLTLRERPRFFSWATRSDATPFWYGELYGDDVPSYVVFKLEWPDYYFTGAKPQKGRCFAIEVGGKPIGQINYNEIHRYDRSAELDILIAHHQYQGKGYGTEAIQLLTHYLFTEMAVRRCRIEVISANPRAIRAYEKAGYQHTYTYIRAGIEWHVMETLADPVPDAFQEQVIHPQAEF